MSGGGQILGTNGTTSATRTLTILEDTDAQLNYGTYPGAWTSALQIQDNTAGRFLWMSPLDAGSAANARLLAAGTGLDIYTNGAIGNAGTLTATFASNGNVGIGTAAPGFRLHVPSGYIGTDYINTTDNVVGSGVTGIMVKAGDNYHRTANASAILAFLGISSGGDNLGNHTATTNLNMSYNDINNVSDIYAINNYGEGLVGVYASTRYQNVWAMGTSWRLAADGSTPGNLYGLAWTHTNVGGQSKPGLSHQLLVMENGITKVALGSGIWTNYTSYLPFFYDTDNTGYYVDPASSSNQNVVTTNDSYTNGWFRNNNSGQGLYNQANGRHFYNESNSYWTTASANGNIFRNGHAGTITGYTYWDGTAGSNNFGLLSPNGAWRFRCDNSYSEAYGTYFYAPTSQIGFIYDRDNTGYYLDANSSSQMSAVYANGWFRPQGNTGLYFQDWGGGWHMTDATWIRSYNSKNVYVDQQLRADGGIISGGLSSLGAGTIRANGNIVNSAPSTGLLAITGDLPGYSVNTYPTVKSGYGWMYFSVGGSFSSYITTAGTYTANSSRDTKENIKDLNKEEILQKINALEMKQWNYKVESPEVQHIAPFAEDFYAKFGLNGTDDAMISHTDPAGVALVGIQALSDRVEEVKSSSDFGSIQMTNSEVWVPFPSELMENIRANTLPVVTLSSNRPEVSMYVSEKNAQGFRIKVSSSLPSDLVVDYIAMAHKQEAAEYAKTAAPYRPDFDKSKALSRAAPATLGKVAPEQPQADQPAASMALPADFKGPEADGAALKARQAQIAAEAAASKYVPVPEDGPKQNAGVANPGKDAAPKDNTEAMKPVPAPKEEPAPADQPKN